MIVRVCRAKSCPGRRTPRGEEGGGVSSLPKASQLFLSRQLGVRPPGPENFAPLYLSQGHPPTAPLRISVTALGGCLPAFSRETLGAHSLLPGVSRVVLGGMPRTPRAGRRGGRRLRLAGGVMRLWGLWQHRGQVTTGPVPTDVSRQLHGCLAWAIGECGTPGEGWAEWGTGQMAGGFLTQSESRAPQGRARD